MLTKTFNSKFFLNINYTLPVRRYKCISGGWGSIENLHLKCFQSNDYKIYYLPVLDFGSIRRKLNNVIDDKIKTSIFFSSLYLCHCTF